MLYWIALSFFRFIAWNTMRIRRSGFPAGGGEGGYILACAHVSHLDPFAIGTVWPRKIGWMARIEFYRRRWTAAVLRRLHCFPVHRQGVPVQAIREALKRLGRGEIVGVFPEGEIKTGRESVLRGGPIKRGVCLLAARSGRPVLPCVVVGTEKLLAISPWLPFKRGRYWVACGPPIAAATGPDRRAARAHMAAEIERAFVRLFAEMRTQWKLPDSIAP